MRVARDEREAEREPVGLADVAPEIVDVVRVRRGRVPHLRAQPHPLRPRAAGTGTGTPRRRNPLLKKAFRRRVVLSVPVLRGIRGWFVFVARGASARGDEVAGAEASGGRPERRRRPEQLGARLGGERAAYTLGRLVARRRRFRNGADYERVRVPASRRLV